MPDRSLRILLVSAVVIIAVIFLSLIFAFFKAVEESYCNSLEPAELLENKHCMKVRK